MIKHLALRIGNTVDTFMTDLIKTKRGIIHFGTKKKNTMTNTKTIF